ncbi:MAG TPA: DNA polymerase III subunit delta [Candidatus Limnocylindrales bacterium]|nr:DNA polymerase III subunit delta [Candidatus Limnocylindrales bacterium]
MALYQDIRKKIIKGEFSPAYLFYGEEKYLQEELIEQLTSVYLGEESSFGRERVDSASATLGEAMSRLEGTNLFAARRLLVVDNPSYFAPLRTKEAMKGPSDEHVEEERNEGVEPQVEILKNFMEQAHPAACPEKIIVFMVPQVDRRKRIYKLFDRKGTAVECSPLQGEALINWIQDRVARMGKKIERAALEKLLLAGDHNLHYLARELDKYCTYLHNNQAVITAEVVDCLFSGDLKGNVFKLADALAERKLAEAIELLELLLGKREKPLLIFFMLIRHYRLLLEASCLSEDGVPLSGLASILGVPPFAARKLHQQAAVYSRRTLEDIIIVLQKADWQIKTGRIEPPQALELAFSGIHHCQSLN